MTVGSNSCVRKERSRSEAVFHLSGARFRCSDNEFAARAHLEGSEPVSMKAIGCGLPIVIANTVRCGQVTRSKILIDAIGNCEWF